MVLIFHDLNADYWIQKYASRMVFYENEDNGFTIVITIILLLLPLTHINCH
jgi:hypothetical protein